MNEEQQRYKRAQHHLYMNQGIKYKIKQFKYTKKLKYQLISKLYPILQTSMRTLKLKVELIKLIFCKNL